MKIAVGLGASLGDRRKVFARSLAKLDLHTGLRVLRVSRLYRSPPMRGGTAQGWFLNAVALLSCELEADELLDFCRSIEDAEGRRRGLHWGDRPLDLDLIVAEDFTRHDARLTLPHPGAALRPFVYWPLLEVWPQAAYTLTSSPPPRYGMSVAGVLTTGPQIAYPALLSA